MRTFFDIQADADRTGDTTELVAAYRHWMRLAPADPLPRYNLSLLLLARGELAEGWALYEARTEIRAISPAPSCRFRNGAVKRLGRYWCCRSKATATRSCSPAMFPS